MTEKTQLILDGPISYLKGFLPGLRGPIPDFTASILSLKGPNPGLPGPIQDMRHERGVILKQSGRKSISFHFWEGHFTPGGHSRPYPVMAPWAIPGTSPRRQSSGCAAPVSAARGGENKSVLSEPRIYVKVTDKGKKKSVKPKHVKPMYLKREICIQKILVTAASVTGSAVKGSIFNPCFILICLQRRWTTFRSACNRLSPAAEARVHRWVTRNSQQLLSLFIFSCPSDVWVNHRGWLPSEVC